MEAIEETREPGAYGADTAYPDTEAVETQEPEDLCGLPAVAYGCILGQDEVLGCAEQAGIPPEAFSEYQEAHAALWDVPTYYVDCEELTSLLRKAGSRVVVAPVPGGLYAAGLPMELLPDDMVLTDYGAKVHEALSDVFPVRGGKRLVFFPYHERPELDDRRDREEAE